MKFFFFSFINYKVLNDAARPWQIGFQDPATPIMEGIVNLHHDIIFFLIIIIIFVSWILFRTLFLFNSKTNPVAYNFSHGTFIELLWTLTPSLVLIGIAVPSFALLYSIDEIIDPAITIKAVGRQWYWSYEYSDYVNEENEFLAFDSYILPEEDLELGQFRLLEVDNRIIIPVNTHIRIIVTGADVIHSWAVPSLGVKCDAIPGRLNQISFFIKREGIYYGQCSEICGVNHGFIPIVIEAVSFDDYIRWVQNKILD
uniref:Cytochrome c oxidase subunit 2 n=1 Tax=Cyanidium caldarium TaxID=2771 RepID=A0A7H0WBA8_CYACA|nr:cytochrome c oxidase subunit 2 [Cyanidium caldarium]QNR39837.1 cytochrome c oxidase subunit 2 [Cyanidium caldarium]